MYSETEALHEEAVLTAAETAKVEVGARKKQLKIDPSSDIKDYYAVLKEKAKPLPPGVNTDVILVPFSTTGVLII